MLQVHHSNRTEQLLRRLLAVIECPPAGTLTPEVCVVQSPGMARWLDQQIALAHGISAGVEFPLPASFVWELYRKVLKTAPECSRFRREALVWHVMAQLERGPGERVFSPLNDYLASGPRELKQFQLSARVADVLDQYLVYRPEMILGWESGADEHWQAELWRAITTEIGESHRARLWREFCTVGPQVLQEVELPQRVSLFGITAIAPAYLDVLSRLADFIDVHLFVLNPCREYWGDIEDERGLARRRRYWKRRGRSDATAYFEIGNPLLASWGKAGRDFVDQLLDVPSEHMDAFQTPDAEHLLARVQTDVLTLRDGTRDRRTLDAPASCDPSIRVHCCHSPLREVQVLHDRILELFETLPDLAPRDIAVMAPDIDAYAPLVDAVFGAVRGARFLPYTVADRSSGAQAPLLETFFALLDVHRSRLGLSEVLDWLQLPAVMRRFHMNEPGIEQMRTWAIEAGVRWGLDGSMRSRLGLPGSDLNTWSFGFDRLFAGYALPDEERLFEDVLPYPDVEGGDAERLGQLRSYVARLEQWRRVLAGSFRAVGWQRHINQLLEDFFEPEETEFDQLQSIREAMQTMVADSADGGFDTAFGSDLLRAYLQSVLNTPSGSGPFLTGAITFCNLVPMRSIPFRVICLLGMDAESFPRVQRPVGFDLIASKPRRGDRSRRADDRYLFLEAMLSARDAFRLSYVGRDQRDNSVKMPAVVVSELLDYLDAAYAEPGEGQTANLMSALVTEHPLQPFSDRCFDPADSRTWSYAAEWFCEPYGDIPGTFADRSLPDEGLDEDFLSLDTLLRFFANPSRYFLRERLGIDLRAEALLPDDTEPFEIDALKAYELRHEALDHSLQNTGTDGPYELARARGELPPGEAGGICYRERIQTPVEHFAVRLREHAPAEPFDAEVAIEIHGLSLRGRLRGLGEAGMLMYRLGKLRAKDRLQAWIYHLVLNAAKPSGAATSTRFLAADRLLTLPPVDDALQRLAPLVELYRQGWVRPLAFFPECSFAYASALSRGKSDTEARAAASRLWLGRRGSPPGEGDDPAVRVAFRDLDPFAEPFPTVAQTVFREFLGIAQES